MSTPSSNQYFEAIHTGPATPSDPNLFTAAEIVAGSFDSAAVSTATSKAVSTVNAAAPDSTSISQASSRAVSAASLGSIADSKALSGSVNVSVLDSKNSSGSVNTSVADSKAVSVAVATPTVTAVVYSGAISVADSKATSIATDRATFQVFNVKSAPYNAKGDGTTDDTAAIVAADAAAALANGEVFFPPGTYKTSQNLLVSRRWRGVPGWTIIKPTAAVTKCFDIRSGNAMGAIIEGFYLDGVNTTGAHGMSIGTGGALPVSEITVRDCQIWRFLGVGGRGIEIQQLVTAQFENIYVDNNYINLHTNGGSTPTDCLFLNCQFREATTKGVWLETGYGLRFIKPLFEANGEEGLYMQNVGGNLTEVTIDDAWYEFNWTSAASGAARRAKYNCFVDGANGPCGTIRIQHVCAKFLENTTTEARAIHYTNCTGFSDYNTKCTNEAGQILIDGTSYGNFEAWNQQNGAYLTTVTNTSAGAWSNRSHLEDNIEAAWTDWTPVFSGNGSMTWTVPVIQKARYKIIGKTCEVQFQLWATTSGSASNELLITLPPNVRAKDALLTGPICITQDAFVTVSFGAVVIVANNPTSSLAFCLPSFGNWGLGAGRGALGTFRFELF